MRKWPVITDCCEKVNLNIKMIERKRKLDAKFDAAFRDAERLGLLHIESILFNRAVHGSEKETYDAEGNLKQVVKTKDSSDIKFILSKKHPDYKPDKEVGINVTVNSEVQPGGNGLYKRIHNQINLN